jgi:glycosyltransferase involved in cell wall biosynthesis
MRLCITSEHRFDRAPDGTVWTASNHSYDDWSRYLGNFKKVRVLARVRDVASPPTAGIRADGPGVSVWPLPYYLGFGEFCKRWRAVKRAAIAGIEVDDAVILKAPSILSTLVEPSLRRRGQPFAVQVIGDPRDSFSAGAMNHPLRLLFREVLTHQTAVQCREASAVSYVTSKKLQTRYPCRPSVFQNGVSDVVLPADFIALEARVKAPNTPLRIITVGSLEQLYKGTDTLVEATHLCVQTGLDLNLIIVGGGRYRPMLEERTRCLGIAARIEFKGLLPAGEAVMAELDKCDLFVLPSRADGLPRAMVEAMARALPCIGSTVGGLPELLDPICLVPPGDSRLLANKIIEVVSTPGMLSRMSSASLTKAREFSEPTLAARRSDFLSYIVRATSEGRLQ